MEVVYIRHHTQAKEVDEHEFFYSQETGGTIVSSALKLMDEVVKERYDPAQWNIYAAQASDGDNWADDSPLCHDILAKKILPVVRYYSYIEITRRAHQTLWREYEHLQSMFDNFAMQHIRDQDDILSGVQGSSSTSSLLTATHNLTASERAGCFLSTPFFSC